MLKTKFNVMLGYDVEYRIPICVNFDETAHLCLVGGTGSGKSIAALYFMYKLLRSDIPSELFIGDFKKSGDYEGISKNFAEFDAVIDLVERFYDTFEQTPEGYNGVKILLLDEYAGFITWLTQRDKKVAEDIKRKIANILMVGRSRHCFVWCIQQRITATLFPAGIGAIDNFQICVGLGRLSPDSRRSLFAGEYPDDTPFMQKYQVGTGRGLILIDGQPIRPFAVPDIRNKSELIMLCRKFSNKPGV